MHKTTLEQVREFHETYGLAVKAAPDLADARINALRVSLLAEELEEFKAAVAAANPLAALDALVDLQYVLDGAFLSLGLHKVKADAFAEVHRSNMSKLGADGKPVRRESDGKVLTGPNFFQPNLQQFIE